MMIPRLFAGPDIAAGWENLADHQSRLGPLPRGGSELIDTLERSGLLGRGGAAFPVGLKWRSVARRSGGSAVVLANGAEGEPLSWKDRLLMAARPHLVLDGAFLAAATVGAGQVVLYVSRQHEAASAAMAGALSERPAAQRQRARIVASPARYVAGEETAAVHFVDARAAVPTAVPPRPFERGVGGRPTLVQNVESLAHAALIARFGDEWYRSAGRAGGAGTLLVTVTGAVRSAGVIEVEAGTSVGEVIEVGGGTLGRLRAVLLGGYFGSWLDADQAWHLPLDAAALAAHCASLGCGVVAAMSSDSCGACESAKIMGYLAGESASQCGPCFFGLRALADACDRLTQGRGHSEDLDRLHRWTNEVQGRGACRHPDGAVTMLQSALRVFEREFWQHATRRECKAA